MDSPLMKLVPAPYNPISTMAYFSHCKTHLGNLHVLNSIKKEIFNKLGLICRPIGEENNCFSQADEVTPAYREHYSPTELFQFLLYASQGLTGNELKNPQSIVPKNDGVFWKSVEMGRALEKESILNSKSRR